MYKLLELNPRERPSAHEALQDEWFAEIDQQNDISPMNHFLCKLKEQKPRNKLQQAALLLLSRKFTQPGQEVIGTFKKLDSGNVGVLSQSDLKEAFRQLKEQIDTQDIRKILENVDINGDGSVDFSEWLAASSLE